MVSSQRASSVNSAAGSSKPRATSRPSKSLSKRPAAQGPGTKVSARRSTGPRSNKGPAVAATSTSANTCPIASAGSATCGAHCWRPADERNWRFRTVGSDLDGIVAKRIDLPYQSGNRDGMQKIKQRRTADCVVGGFRYATGKDTVGSLLLGLYDEQGLLHHVGFTSGIKSIERQKITDRLKPLMKAPGFTGRAPGGPSRWSTKRSSEWEPLSPELVVEVQYDHFTGDRFRHGTSLLRWRPDKRPQDCDYRQVSGNGSGTLKLLKKSANI